MLDLTTGRDMPNNICDDANAFDPENEENAPESVL